MPRCNQTIPEGEPRSRTCAKCGLGPCKETHRQENAMLKNIAGLIAKLSYRDMQTFAEALWVEIDFDDPGGKDGVAEAVLKVAEKLLK